MGCINDSARLKTETNIQNLLSIQWNILPPSDRWSEASDISNIVKKSPKKIFQQSDVSKCFLIGSNEDIPQICNKTQKGFDILEILWANSKPQNACSS